LTGASNTPTAGYHLRLLLFNPFRIAGNKETGQKIFTSSGHINLASSLCLTNPTRAQRAQWIASWKALSNSPQEGEQHRGTKHRDDNWLVVIQKPSKFSEGLKPIKKGKAVASPLFNQSIRYYLLTILSVLASPSSVNILTTYTPLTRFAVRISRVGYSKSITRWPAMLVTSTLVSLL